MRIIAPGGAVVDLGVTEATPTVSINDYSRRETDEFGVTTVVKRGFARRMSVRFALPFDAVDAVQQLLATLRATPVRWEADERFAWLNFVGFYKEFSLDLALPPLSYCTLNVEGLAETEVVADAGGDPAPDGKPSSLLLLQPETVTNAALIGSTVPENEHPQWAVDTTYAAGAQVISAHRIYESAVAGNLGNDPASSSQWIDVAPTNRWAMFDQALGTLTTSPASFSVTVNVGAADAVALLDVSAAYVRVQAPGGYDSTRPAGEGAITFLDLPGAAGDITISVIGSGAVSVGTLLAGHLVTLGVTEASPSAGITDFSRKEVDDFGEVTIVERAWAKRMETRALIRTEAVDLVANRIAAVRAVPSLWIGDEGTDSLTIYGFFKDFSIEVGENVSTLSLSVEGLSQAAQIAAPVLAPNWPDIVDSDPVNQPKPADGATVGGTVGENITDEGGNVLAPGELLNSALDFSPAGILSYTPFPASPAIEIGRVDLDRAGGTAVREANSAIDKLAAAVMLLTTEASQTRATFRDAGMYVDPANGLVRINAVDQTQERVSDVSVRVDAMRSEILLRATTTYVNNAIAQAVIDPSQVPVFDQLEVRISAAEIRLDGIDGQIELLASVTELTTLSGRVTTAEGDINALQGTIGLKVDTTTFDALATRVTSAETVLEAIGDTASISNSVTVARLAQQSADEAAATGLHGLLTADEAKRRSVQAIGHAREELTAKINADLSVEAAQRLALGARVGSAEVSIIATRKAAADGDSALAASLEGLSATVEENSAAVEQIALAQAGTNGEIFAGLQSNVVAARLGQEDADAAAESALMALLTGDEESREIQQSLAAARQELTAKVNADVSAVVQLVTALVARVGAAQASLLLEASARADADSAQAQQLAQLGAEIGGVSAAVDQESVARVNADGALSSQINTISTAIATETSNRTAAVSNEAQARLDADGALAGQITTVSTTVNGHSATITSHASALDGLDAKAGIRLDVNGRVTGWALNNNGDQGDMIIVADKFTLIDPDTDLPYFFVDEGGAKLHSVEVDTLKLGSMDYEFELKQTISATQGSQTLPGGVVMKWGKYRAFINDEVQLSILFDVPFPTECQSFVPVPYLATYSVVRDLWLQNVGNPTRFGATVGTQSSTSNSQRLDGFDWVAFGI